MLIRRQYANLIQVFQSKGYYIIRCHAGSSSILGETISSLLVRNIFLGDHVVPSVSGVTLSYWWGSAQIWMKASSFGNSELNLLLSSKSLI